MKQFSSILNMVLLAAVAVLYYLHFSSNNQVKSAPANAVASMEKDSCAIGHLIAYVDLDSLNSNVTFIKERKKELEAEQKQIASEYENAYHQLEAEKNNFLKKGNAITQKEAEEFQGQLMQKQQEVETNKQTKGQGLAAKGANIMEGIQSKLKAFINEYNKDKRYSYIFATGSGVDNILYKDSLHNITSDIVKGFNEIMNKKGN